MPRQHAYTLIELILVMILLGIVGVFVSARFTGSDGIAEFSYQARALSALRNMQQRAMQDTANAGNDSVYRIVFSSSPPEFGPPVDAANLGVVSHSPDYLSSADGEITSDSVVLSLNDVSQAAPFSFIRFDALGRPVNDFGAGASCQTGCQVHFVGSVTASLCIESQGFVHVGVCHE